MRLDVFAAATFLAFDSGLQRALSALHPTVEHGRAAKRPHALHVNRTRVTAVQTRLANQRIRHAARRANRHH